MARRTSAEWIDEGGKNAGVGTPHHALPAAEVLALLRVSADIGLTDEEARNRLERNGQNTIESRRKVSLTHVLLHQFRSPVVYLLGTAAALSLYFGEWEEAAAIGVVLALNALIGFATELKAARSIEALRALGTCSVRVRRDGHMRLISAEQMVPGDIVMLDAGDAIAADLRLLEASNLAADESTLTGESVAVDKSADTVAPDVRLGDRSSMLYKGTFLTRGNGIGVVVSTGLLTELGRVSQLVEEAEPGRSPLENKLARLSAQLIWATLILSAVIAAVGVTTGEDLFLMVESAIALAVAAIPEGLPIVATLALARGMWRMARQDALIERLSAVETLGATTIILTDKTGTLTENRMTVRRLWVSSGEIDIGSGQATGQSLLSDDPQVRSLLEVGILCNDAFLESVDESGSGDPMELALLRVGFRAGLKRLTLLGKGRIVRKYAFDSSTKMMAVVQHREDGFLFAIKGAPEEVLAASERGLCERGEIPMESSLRREWLKRVEEFGHRGLRVLACGMKMSMQEEATPYESLTFVGLVGLDDPARADVTPAVQACRQAGIRVVMVTGDHAVTARSIARAVGLAHEANIVVEGKQLERLTKSNSPGLSNVGIFARVSPAEKLELVRTFQAAGEIVAMTGDGVNDAPALRQADIGVAMGLRGTDVAREAAAMILLDDAFSTIVKAIREGRVIFGNIRRFAAYLLACNLTEVLVIGLPVLSTLPLPILPLQILYLNLVTDVFPAFALAMGEGDGRILKRPPRDPQEPILGRSQWLTIMLQSLAMTAGTLGALALARVWLNLNADAAITVTFLTLAFAQLWHVFNMRNPHSGLVRNEITRNAWIWGSLFLCVVLLAVPPYIPTTADVLHLVPPTPTMWAIVFVMSLAPTLAIQVTMLVLMRRDRGESRLRAGGEDSAR